MGDSVSSVSLGPGRSEADSTGDRAPAAAVPVPGPRLWPLAVILGLQWTAMVVPGWIAPATVIQFYGGFMGPLVGGLIVALWWGLASRLGRADRLLGLLFFIAAGFATWLLADRSFQPIGLLLYGLPTTTTALAMWLFATPRLRWPIRRAGALLVVLLAWGYFLTVRYEGVDGSFAASFPWRWTVSAEDQFLAEHGSRKPATPVLDTGSRTAQADAALPQSADWPGFRGPNRDGRCAGVRIATDWQANPPRQLWRQRVGPGWSSFAVVGTRAYTQEQRGPREAVICYDAGTGAELWAHEDEARFMEAMAGPGPRATPTFHEDKIYAQGATGKLNCLDAGSGSVLWTRDVAADSDASVPQWGFSASPLVVQGIVVVFAGGADGKSVLGYDAASGKLAWSAGEGQYSYCSPHPARVAGLEQVLIATDRGLTAFQSANGAVLWRHDWPLQGGMARVTQPLAVSDSDFLLGTGFGIGTRRLQVRRDGDLWAAKELWTTRAIKPYYNDIVLHKGHLYGFDPNFLTCVNASDGKGKWRARGYGNGQVLLLPDQDLLLVQAESGAIALVEANPDAHVERARFQGLDGKTWNHPVVAQGKLFVRNGQEAACYDLRVEKAPSLVPKSAAR